ncbi:MAG TPA: efflux RND transporter permease subunit, partial [Thermoanaerobaculia bacterium]|nr:efflux RND transporter permease subunit [Thermoanaerobaculia bacterium]
AMIAATLLSVTLVPVLATFLIRGRIHGEQSNPVMRGARRLYQPLLRSALDHKAVTLLIAASVLVLSLILVAGGGVLLQPVRLPLDVAAALGSPRAGRAADRISSTQAWLDGKLARGIGNEFMPPLDEGTLMFMPVTSNAISLTSAVEIMKKQDAVLRSFPEVASVVGKVGRAESPLDPAPINMFETLVELTDRSEWRPGMTKEKLIDEMTEKSRLPGVTTIWQQPIRNRIDMLATGIPTQVGVKIFGPDLQVLEQKAREVAEVLRALPGAVDIYPEQILGTPYLEIVVDRDAVARYGAAVADVLDVVETALGGKDVTTTIEGRNRFAVRVRYARELRDDVEAIERVLVDVPALAGGMAGAGLGSVPASSPRMARVPLAELAAIRIRPGPSMISAENGLLRERVFLNVRGRDVGSFVDEAKRAVHERVSLPSGYFLEWSGQYEHQVRARNRLLVVVPACFAIIFVLLWMTYRSWKEAAHVILAIPFALTGGNLLLWALHVTSAQLGWKTGFHWSVAVWVGYIALFGTAVQTAVVMVVYLEEALQRQAATAAITVERIRAAAMEGAVLRLRPKLMTVSTVVMGLLPIMWSTATGSEVAKPIATPVLGGMLSSLV